MMFSKDIPNSANKAPAAEKDQSTPTPRGKKQGGHAARVTSPYVFDTLLAIALTLFAWLQALTSRAFFDIAPNALNRPVDVPIGFNSSAMIWTLLLLALCFVPLALRRKYPLVVLGLTVMGQITVSLLTRDPILSLVGPLIALYTAGLMVGRKKLIVATGLTALLLVGAIWLPTAFPSLKTEGVAMLLGGSSATSSFEGDFGSQPFGGPGGPGQGEDGITPFAINVFAFSRGSEFTQALETLALLIAAAAFGYSIKSNREYAEEAQRRAEQAEKTREEVARRRLEEERLRIARELHDITAHSLSAVAVQAGAAEKLVKTKPELAEQTIEQIRLTSKEALEELRSIVGVLRDENSGDEAPLVPEAGIERIRELVEPLKAKGIDVNVSTSGVENIPAYAGMAAYRIVQEASTNILRHAHHATRVDITLTRNGDELSIAVVDNGDGAVARIPEATYGGGHGITGMRERALALGGTLKAEPLPAHEGGGFIVEAKLPLLTGD